MSSYIIDIETATGIYTSFLLIGLCIPIAKIMAEILKDRM